MNPGDCIGGPAGFYGKSHRSRRLTHLRLAFNRLNRGSHVPLPGAFTPCSSCHAIMWRTALAQRPMPQPVASVPGIQKKSSVDLRTEEELPALSCDARWQLVQRIASSESFARASRLSTFLVYVTRQALAREGADLNEQSIGERVFGRPAGYDSREDNIVRAHASRLRQRLDVYFASEGAHESLRVTIPRGSYVPLFERAAHAVDAEPIVKILAASAEQGDEAVPAVDSPLVSNAADPRWSRSNSSRRNRFPLLAAMAATVVMLSILAYIARQAWPSLRAEAAGTPTHRLWSQMFSKDRNTLIVPADSSLVLFAQLTGHRVPLADYANGRYKTDFSCAGPCDQAMVRGVAERRYTSLADLEFAVALTRRPESIPNRTQIRFVRDLQLEDFKQSNLILVGSLEADPWLELIENQMDFVLEDDWHHGIPQILNRHPHNGEPQKYLYGAQGSQQHGLAAIAFLPNLNGVGNILVVQGFTLADTEAAAEFVTDGKDLDALLGPVLRNRSTLPHFECLLETMDVNGVSSHPAVLAWHVHSD